MIGAEVIAALEQRKLESILGAPERTDKLVREGVLADDAPYLPPALEKRGKTTEYGAKAVEIDELRHIVRANHGPAAKVAADAKFDGIFVLRTNTALDPIPKA